MDRRRLFSLSLVLLVLTFFLFKLISPLPLYARQKLNSHNVLKWAVILSPGPTPGVPWGGYHITITGYSKANGGLSKKTFLEGAYKTVLHGRPWHLHGNHPNLVKWKGTYTQILISHTLDELSSKLVTGGFDNIKGPNQGKVPWHISLHSDRPPQSEKLMNSNTLRQTGIFGNYQNLAKHVKSMVLAVLHGRRFIEARLLISHQSS